MAAFRRLTFPPHGAEGFSFCSLVSSWCVLWSKKGWEAPCLGQTLTSPHTLSVHVPYAVLWHKWPHISMTILADSDMTKQVCAGKSSGQTERTHFCGFGWCHIMVCCLGCSFWDAQCSDVPLGSLSHCVTPITAVSRRMSTTCKWCLVNTSVSSIFWKVMLHRTGAKLLSRNSCVKDHPGLQPTAQHFSSFIPLLLSLLLLKIRICQRKHIANGQMPVGSS